jgi:hypothetical protein
LVQSGDCSIFHAKACSLPPDPKSKMFISTVSLCGTKILGFGGLL